MYPTLNFLNKFLNFLLFLNLLGACGNPHPKSASFAWTVRCRPNLPAVIRYDSLCKIKPEPEPVCINLAPPLPARESLKYAGEIFRGHSDSGIRHRKKYVFPRFCFLFFEFKRYRTLRSIFNG